ncbi:MAG: GntR family transcriptional regulator [Caldilineaceae bacterium]|nr:GntR family transcriptional regulator [Caldilineaceae bacterium]
MLEPLTRAFLPEQATRSIKQFILNKQLLPGDQLPSERYLTELLGVSRTVVREALQMLVAEGLLVKEPGRGVFVRDFDARNLENQLAGEQQGAAQTRSLLEVRAALEIGALTFVAQRSSPADLARLRALVADMRRRLEANQPIITQDREFHDLLTQAVDNPSFAYFKRLVQDAIQASTHSMAHAYTRPADRNTVETAEQLVAALQRRDIEEAQRAMRAHLLIDRPPDQARVFLFVDDEEIAAHHKLTRRIQPANKYPHNPVLCAESPWEGQSVLPTATVLYDVERMRYQLWYHGYEQLSPREEVFSLCYATSIDGVHWAKPALGVCEFGGSAANNLVMPRGDARVGDVTSATLLLAPAGENRATYTMIYYGAGIHSAGVCLALSDDGLRWRLASDAPFGMNGAEPVGDTLYCIPDPAADRVVAYYRIPLRARPQATLGRMESHDLRHWTGHRAILTGDDQDPPDAEPLGLTPFRYGELTLGLLWMHRRNEGSTELQLVCSRDGDQWARVGDRRPFLPVGAPGAFDHHAVMRATIPVVVGNELWLYYAGASLPSTGWKGPSYQIGLATLTLDRFVALEAENEEGSVTTRAIPCTDQTQLLVNAVVNPGGYLLVEVLDANGEAIVGFSRDEAVPFTDNAVYHPITWKTQDDLATLTGRAVSFHFILRNAALYAFRLAHPNARNSDLIAGIC